MADEKEFTTTENREGLTESEQAADEQPSAESTDFFAESLAALQKERDQYYDRLLRTQAEFENYRRRVEKEKSDLRFATKQEILRELLNVLDACERGMLSMDNHEASLETYREGYELLYKQIKNLLTKYGVEPIEAVGQAFDPNVHEAILHEASPVHDEGEVIDELKKGYRLKDRLLRPAQVKVARKQAKD